MKFATVLSIIWTCLWMTSMSTTAFVPPTRMMTTPSSTTVRSMELSMAAPTSSSGNPNNDANFMRWAKASRSAGAEDTVVELVRPLGLVLNQDEQGNVFVEQVAPNGNAARSGKVREGDIVTMCSATFGDEMWSTRGVGLSRVMAAIRVRSGATVKLVLESPKQYQQKKQLTTQQLKAKADAYKSEQAKKDMLLGELERDEQRLKKKFLGLF